MVRNKKILLVKLEDNYQVYPPYGLMYLASALKSNGYEFEIFHERITRKNLNLLIKKAKDAFVVGFSVTTTPSLMAVLKSSQEIKRKYKTPIIWGGCHATMLPEINLKDKGVDFIIMKEGEESLIQLLKCLESGIEPKDVPGVGYKKKEGIKVNQFTKIIDNLDKYNYDFIWDYLDIKKYLSPRFGKYRRVLPVITSRGCPHDCYFCYNSFMYNRKWRKHNVEFVIKGINRLKEKYNIDGIYYIDDNLFTINDRGFKIIEKIGLPWIAQARADYITEKFAKRAKELRCEGLYIGAESGSNRVLKEVINKGITTENIENAVRICDKYNIKSELSFIIGMPYETEGEIRQTLRFMYHLHKKYKKVFFWGPKLYTPYPGTLMYKKGVELGFKGPKNSVEWGIKFYRYGRYTLPWIKNKNINLLYLVVGLAQMKKNFFTAPIKSLEEWRWKNFNLNFPLELEIARKLSKIPTFLSLFFKYFAS